jgi:PGF-pre-PGF domain-containing protein
MRKLNERPHIGWRAITLLVLVLAAFCIAPVAADDVGGIQMPGAKNFNLILSDGLTKYFKFEGGGINALHITTDPDDAYGQVTTSGEQSGVFYLSDTGGRGFFDDMILMIAVNGTIPDDFAVHIRASGYRWTPTPVLNQPPMADEIEYTDGSYEGTITKSDFVYRPQTWKPAGDNAPGNYPIYEGQDMSDTSNTFHMVFVDLNTGIIGENSMIPDMIDNGAMKIEYEFENLETFAAFNSYGWCNQSNQGQGISWTNRVSDTGSSGYMVLGTGSSGDTAADGEGTAAESGLFGQEVETSASDSFNGAVSLIPATGAPVSLKPGSTADLSIPVDGVNGTVRGATLYVFVSGSQQEATAYGIEPALSFTVNGRNIDPDRKFADSEGSSGAPQSMTCAFDLNDLVAGQNTLTIQVRYGGPAGSVCTLSGALLLLSVENPDLPLVSLQVAECCDAVGVGISDGVFEEDAMTTAAFDAPSDMNQISESRLIVVGTAAEKRDGTQDHVGFNERQWTGAFNRSGMVRICYLEPGPAILPGENEVRIGTGADADDNGVLVNRLIVLEYGGGQVEDGRDGDDGVASSPSRIAKAFLIDSPVVSKVVLSLPADNAGVWITAADRTDALTAPAPDAEVYRYVMFDLGGAAAASTPAAITFRVPEEWLTERVLSPGNVVMLRFAEGQWTPLSTRLLEVENGYAEYSAESDSLALFAVAAREVSDPISPAATVSPASSAPPRSPLSPLLPLIAALIGFIILRRD